eukprot:TRINITY_DN22066_c0_g1_i1.p1 TRINITY_DN22066_c0_g1~~TRINITY_DN22066_c0_g1_i1.p1  ORF type:complete len:270 (+),score=20.63 TRINITY_DN22066_c0_g1_i1:67-876(+)
MSHVSLGALASCLAIGVSYCEAVSSSPIVPFPRISVKLIEYQGCQDCVEYGTYLVRDGLKKGLGGLMNLSVFLRSGHTSTSQGGVGLHAWVACGNNVTGLTDQHYLWYQVASCAMYGGEIVESCREKVIAETGGTANESLRSVQECANDTARSEILVKAMHTVGDTFQSFPSVSVAGQALPQPDQNGNSVKPLVAGVCSRVRQLLGQAIQPGTPSLPVACGSVPSGMSLTRIASLTRTSRRAALRSMLRRAPDYPAGDGDRKREWQQSE